MKIELPDHKILTLEENISGIDLAKKISISLSKIAVGIKINNKLFDIRTIIKEDCAVEIITTQSKEAIDILRHSCAHLLAHAVKEIYQDKVQITIGPVIEDGFYYDFATDIKFSTDDLSNIEKKMLELAKQNMEIKKEIRSHDEAVSFFKNIGEHYKAKIIDRIPNGEDISFYSQDNFIDLCRGPHLCNTSLIKYFKLIKVSGAYWEGNSKNEMLQRIYGTAFFNKEELESHLNYLKELEKKDHRKLAEAMDLFHQQQEAPGDVFWHPKGFKVWTIIENYIRDLIADSYQEVRTPHLLKKIFWEKSGHWQHYRDNMFTSIVDEEEYALKPMNCPAHIQIFNDKLRSYKELPIRFSEFGCCHRYEPSGSLHGLMRVRSMVQDDGHIFCTKEQIESEANLFIQTLIKAYKDFGFENVSIKLSTRPNNFAGKSENWDLAEKLLENALKNLNLSYEIQEGEGAFYGPKLEFHIKDSLKRSWQCGTFQLDFVLPERLGCTFINQNNEKEIPVMLHRAIFGSRERWIGIILEHYGNQLPLWLSPVHIVLIPINEKYNDYIINLNDKLIKQGVRSEVDISNKSLNYKIRHHFQTKIPMIATIGEKEIQNQTLSIKKIGNSNIEIYKFEDLINLIKNYNGVK